MEYREKMNMRAPADQEASTLRDDIVITLTLTPTPSQEVESEAHCLGHMRPSLDTFHPS
jgi:hypothetical protein